MRNAKYTRNRHNLMREFPCWDFSYCSLPVVKIESSGKSREILTALQNSLSFFLVCYDRSVFVRAPQLTNEPHFWEKLGEREIVLLSYSKCSPDAGDWFTTCNSTNGLVGFAQFILWTPARSEGSSSRTVLPEGFNREFLIDHNSVGPQVKAVYGRQIGTLNGHMEIYNGYAFHLDLKNAKLVELDGYEPNVSMGEICK